jgi:hypothetical protein
VREQLRVRYETVFVDVVLADEHAELLFRDGRFARAQQHTKLVNVELRTTASKHTVSRGIATTTSASHVATRTKPLRLRSKDCSARPTVP